MANRLRIAQFRYQSGYVITCHSVVPIVALCLLRPTMRQAVRQHSAQLHYVLEKVGEK